MLVSAIQKIPLRSICLCTIGVQEQITEEILHVQKYFNNKKPTEAPTKSSVLRIHIRYFLP